MIKKIKGALSPQQALAALLDAGAEELLTLSDFELALHLATAGAEGRDALEAIRRLVNAADSDADAEPVSIFHVIGRRDHLTDGR